ncbi:MAG: hypothetical protein ABSC50_14190 [Candidatus Bathyarchaeia archaeon]
MAVARPAILNELFNPGENDLADAHSFTVYHLEELLPNTPLFLWNMEGCSWHSKSALLDCSVRSQTRMTMIPMELILVERGFASLAYDGDFVSAVSGV